MALDRRRFLTRTAAAGGLASFFGPLELMNVARAQAGPYPLRFIALFSPHGTLLRRWRPRANQGTYHMTDFDIGYDESILQPLGAYKNNMILLDGLDYRTTYEVQGQGHEGGMVTALTGCRPRIEGPDTTDCVHGSVDQYLASQIGTGFRFPSIELGVGLPGGTGRLTTLCYGPGGVPLPNFNDPVAVYDRLFKDLTGDQGDAARRLIRRRSVLDHVLTELNSMQMRGGKDVKAALEVHAESIRGIERSLEQNVSCPVIGSPDYMDPVTPENLPAITKQQIDLLALALHCQQTRVASLQIFCASSGLPMPFIGFNYDIHHEITHAVPNEEDKLDAPLDDAEQKLRIVQQWYSEQVRYLLEKLASMPEGDGTLLDNTVILWVNELGNPCMHGNINIPALLMGGANAPWQMGRWLKLTQDQEPNCLQDWAQPKCAAGSNPWSGQSAHNQLLVSVLRGFGVPADHFGWDAVTGPLAGL